MLMINSVTTSSTDISVISFDPRNMESLVYSYNEAEHIIEHLDRFIDSIHFYKSKQLLYKTGLLLYGEPGTGKSTLVKMLATKYDRNIVQINISNINSIDFAELTTMINNDIYEKYIVLLEDIDTLYLKRDIQKDKEEEKEEDEYMGHRKKKSVHESLHDLMQFLDSNSSPNNVIFVATTNDIGALDAAMLRDGRFDLKIEIKPIKESEIERFCEIFEVDYQSNKEKILADYGEAKLDKDGEKMYNQSKLQNILLKLK